MINKTIPYELRAREYYSKMFYNSEWFNFFKEFIQSQEFLDIMSNINDELQQGKKITPNLSDIFRGFLTCKNPKVVFIAQDPYPKDNVADGIAFSCSNTNKPQPSLKYIFKAIESTTGKKSIAEESCDLELWSRQGILMLNTALTTEKGKAGAHLKYWEAYANYVMQKLNDHNEQLIFVFLGSVSQKLATFINNPIHRMLFVKHPASAAYTGSKWDCNDIFNEINKMLLKQSKEEIIW